MWADFPRNKHLKQAIYRGPGGAGDATGDATNASVLAVAAKDEAQASASAAASSATAASNSATAADTSADEAAASATSAASSASGASTSATNASNSASDASDSATAAVSSATDAASSATAAASSASAASTSASSASSSASAASTSASNASTSATNAASSASTASTQASNASTSASSAATSATNAASSATAAASSATDAAASAASINDASLVHKATDETITGTKTFTANQIISVTDNTDAALRITQLGTGNALLVEDATNPDSSPVVVDNAGGFIQGYTSALATKNYAGNAVTPAFQQHGTGISTSTLGSTIWESGSTSNASGLILSRSKSSTIGTNATVISGDFLGTVSFNGDDGTSFVTAASIAAAVDGTPGTNDMPGRLVFSTTADGASSPTERMRINSDGAVGIGTSTLTGYRLRIGGNLTGATTAYGISPDLVVNSDVTALGIGFHTSIGTQATSFTLTNLRHYSARQATIGAGSTLTNQYGYWADSTLTGATNNYGFYSNIASGTGRYNFYAAGTADNYFAGNLILGSSTLATPTGSAPSYLCRAWVSFNSIGTVSIYGSGNVSSISDNGVGNFSLNFSTGMPDTVYSLVGFAKRDNASPGFGVSGGNNYTKTTSSMQIGVFYAPTAGLSDSVEVNCAVFR